MVRIEERKKRSVATIKYWLPRSEMGSFSPVDSVPRCRRHRVTEHGDTSMKAVFCSGTTVALVNMYIYSFPDVKPKTSESCLRKCLVLARVWCMRYVINELESRRYKFKG